MKNKKAKASSRIRRSLNASPEAAAALAARLAASAQARAEEVESRRHVAQVAATERERGGEVEAVGGDRLTVLSRDGLRWAFRRGVLSAIAYQAGLTFRAAYERANGTGPRSSLAAAELGGGSSFGPGVGATDAQVIARGEVNRALAALGTPLLHPFVVGLAGEGDTLSSSRFVEDPRRVGEVTLPCRIAFDLLARHYGMIR